MHNAVVLTHHGIVGEAEFRGIALKGLHLAATDLIGESGPFGGDVVIRHADYASRAEDAAAAPAYAFKRLGAGDLVAIEPVYVELSRAAVHKGDDMTVPDFVEKGVHLRKRFIQSMNASTDAVTISVSAPNP